MTSYVLKNIIKSLVIITVLSYPFLSYDSTLCGSSFRETWLGKITCPKGGDPASKIERLCKIRQTDGNIICMPFPNNRNYGKVSQWKVVFFENRQNLKNFQDFFRSIYKFAGRDPKDTIITCGFGVLAEVSLGDIGQDISSQNKAIDQIINACKNASSNIELPNRQNFNFPSVGTPYSNPFSDALAAFDKMMNECEQLGDGTAMSGFVEIVGLVGAVASIASIIYIIIDESVNDYTDPTNINIVIDPPEESGTSVYADGVLTEKRTYETEKTYDIPIPGDGNAKVEQTTFTTITTTTADGEEPKVESTEVTIITKITNPDGSKVVNKTSYKIDNNTNKITTRSESQKYDRNGNPIPTQATGGLAPGTDPGQPGQRCWDMDCTYSCEEKKAWWGFFKKNCESTNWQDYECRSFLAAIGGCAPPLLALPSPDGEFVCYGPVDEKLINKLREELCRRQQWEMFPAEPGREKKCIASSNFNNFKLDNICGDPRAKLFEDQCLLSINFPIGGPTIGELPEVSKGGPNPINIFRSKIP